MHLCHGVRRVSLAFASYADRRATFAVRPNGMCATWTSASIGYARRCRFVSSHRSRGVRALACRTHSHCLFLVDCRWHALTHCSWAPMCPPVLLSISFIHRTQHHTIEKRLAELAQHFKSQAAFGYMVLPQHNDLAASFLGHFLTEAELPLHVVYRRGQIAEISSGKNPSMALFDSILGVPNHQHGNMPHLKVRSTRPIHACITQP
jgi:hypothetical protein